MRVLVIGIAVAAALAGAAQAADVRVTLTGLQPRGGRLLVSLQARDQFMKSDGTAGAVFPGDVTGEKRFTLGEVPPGDYALFVLHDEDGNRRMTLDDAGRPAEGWTTRNAAELRAKPRFDEVSVHVPADGVSLTLPMIYPAKP